MPYSLGLIAELSKRHHVYLTLHALGASLLGTEWRELLPQKIQVHYGGGTASRQKQPLSFYRSEKRFLREASATADIVHMQDTNDVLLLFTFFLALRARKGPFVLTVHDPLPHSGDAPRLYQLRKPLIHRLRAMADAIVVLSEHCRGEFIRSHPHIPPERISVIPHGAMDFFLRWKPQEVIKQRRTVLFFGRVVAYKGLGVLLQAWEKVTQEVPDARLIVAGKGPDLTTHLPKIETTPSIQLIAGYLDSPEISKLFARSAVLVLPYVDATQSGVLSIAYPFGVPAIASDVGGLGDMIEPGVSGLLVPPKDPEMLAAALIELLTNDELYIQLCKGVEHLHRERFSWKVLAPRFENLYSQLCGPTRRWRERTSRRL